MNGSDSHMRTVVPITGRIADARNGIPTGVTNASDSIGSDGRRPVDAPEPQP